MTIKGGRAGFVDFRKGQGVKKEEGLDQK